MVTDDGRAYQAKVFVDSSYEGDLLAKAGVSYTIGRESKQDYGEPYAGVQPGSTGPVVVSPYLVPGNSQSGVIPHVFKMDPKTSGSSDKGIMAYNYRLCISTDPNNQIKFKQPDNYSAAEFEALGRYSQRGRNLSVSNFVFATAIPNRKLDINDNSLFLSLDNVGEC